MGLGRRHARQHETAAFQKNAMDTSVYWEFKPQQQVMTVDGFPGVVTAVYDGPVAGYEEYQVTLDNGLGGGSYTASQLSPLAGTTASHDHEATGLHLASDDYEELHDILRERPPIERMTFSAARSDFDFQHEETDTGGTKFPRRVDMTVHHPETGDEVGKARYFPPKRRGGPISIDEVKGHQPGAASALLDEIESRHPGSSTKFLYEVKRNNNNPDVTGHAHERAGQPTDWDTHYPHVAPTIHRGLSLRLPSYSARTVNSSGASKDEHLAEIHSAMPTGPNVGTHWTEDEHAARLFANNAVSDYRTDIPVVLHAKTPAQKDLETRPAHLYRGGVFPYGDPHSSENEIPVRRGRDVHVTGISWKPDAPHPDADENGWMHHTYDEPMHHTASLTAVAYGWDDDEYGDHDEHEEEPRQDWDDILSGVDEIHRGVGVHLHPSIHRIVHDPSRPAAERAHLLLREIAKGDPDRRRSGHGIGTHWTTTQGVAEDFAEKHNSGEVAMGKNHTRMIREKNHMWGTDDEGDPKPQPGTAVVLHAHPDRESVDENPDPFSHGSSDIYDYHSHGEREVPYHPGASVHIKGISWKPMDDFDDHDYTRHDFADGGRYHTAVMEDLTDEDAPEAEPELPPCAYCGSDQMEIAGDTGRAQQAKCQVCGGMMSAPYGLQFKPELIGDPSNHPKDDPDPASGGVPGAANMRVPVKRMNDSDYTASLHEGALPERECDACHGTGVYERAVPNEDAPEDAPDSEAWTTERHPCDDCNGRGFFPAMSDQEEYDDAQQHGNWRYKSHVTDKLAAEHERNVEHPGGVRQSSCPPWCDFLTQEQKEARDRSFSQSREGSIAVDNDGTTATKHVGFAGYVEGHPDTRNPRDPFDEEDARDIEKDQAIGVNGTLGYLRRNVSSKNPGFWHEHAEVKDVPLNGPIYSTQPRVVDEHVQRYMNNPQDETAHTKTWKQHGADEPNYPGSHMPMFIRHEGNTYVHDGHHRVAAALLRKDPSIKGYVYDADQKGIPTSWEDERDPEGFYDRSQGLSKYSAWNNTDCEFDFSDPEEALDHELMHHDQDICVATHARRNTHKTASADEQDTSYRMQHQAPDADYGAPLHDVTNMMPGFYEHPEWYNHGQEHLHESMSVIHGAHGRPEKKVRIYRALPAEHAGKGFNTGDWVSTSKSYARQHAMVSSDSKHDWPVISTTVPAKHLHTEGDVHEWAYNGPHEPNASVAFKGGYHQEVRQRADGSIGPVQRKANPFKDRANELKEKGYSFSHYRPGDGDPDHTVVAYDHQDNWAGQVKAHGNGEVHHVEIEPEHAHEPLEQHMRDMIARETKTGSLHEANERDWCTFRHNARCNYPGPSDESGLRLSTPQDRGPCAWDYWQQQVCPISEPGPMALMQAKGSLVNDDIRDPEFRFHFIASWSDVRAKARRLRTEGHVNITVATSEGVGGEVKGDHHVYETLLTYVPGTAKVGAWECGCKWAAFAWGRSPAYRRFEGRMCSHALAMQFEAQSKGMFGRTVEPSTERPKWLRHHTPVVTQYERDTGENLTRRAVPPGNMRRTYEGGRNEDFANAVMADYLLLKSADVEGVYDDGHSLDLVHPPVYAQVIEQLPEIGPVESMRWMAALGLTHAAARAVLKDASAELATGELHYEAALRLLAEEEHDESEKKRCPDCGAMISVNDEKCPHCHHVFMKHERHHGVKEEQPEPPSVSGVALKAADTGRVLMLQRGLEDEKDPAAGTWEFPGGHHEEGDQTSLHAGIREWEEETGHPFPEGGVVHHTWTSPNGVYQGHLVLIPEERAVQFGTGRQVVNPDNPDGDLHEQAAWWDPDHARKNPALRQELKTGTPWKEIKAAGNGKTAATADPLYGLEESSPMSPPQHSNSTNPASSGWATTQDPTSWDDPEENSTNFGALPADGYLGSLHNQPEPALPSTDGAEAELDDERDNADPSQYDENDAELTPNTTLASAGSTQDIVARFQATAGARALGGGPGGVDDSHHAAQEANNKEIANAAKQFLTKSALKDFNFAEQQELINEGARDKTMARNSDVLNIEGTHYSALEAALAAEDALEDSAELFA